MTKFSSELRELTALAGGKPITLGRLLEELKDRGDALFLLVINIPFMIPMPAFGLSTPVGIVVMLMGWCIWFNKPLWLPKWIRNLEVGPHQLEKIVNGTLLVTGKLERAIKPRMGMMFWPGMLHVSAIELVAAGFALALPLPIPGTNFIFAIIIITIAVGLLERDGLFMLLAHVITLVEIVIAIVACYVVWYYGVEALKPYLPEFIAARMSQG